MNCFRMLVALLALLPLPASAQSVFSFFQSQDVVFKPELLGKWTIEETVTVEFRDAGNQTYGIILNGIGDDNFLIARAHLIYLGGRYFLDVQAVELHCPDPEQAKPKPRSNAKISFDLDPGNFLLVHNHGLILLTLSSNPNEFTGTLWNDNWLPKTAEQKKLKIPYLKDETGRILLTAESSQLRQFVANLPDEAFSGESGKLTRIVAESPKVTK